MVVTEDKLG